LGADRIVVPAAEPAVAAAYVGLGSNLGDRAVTIAAAVAALRKLPATEVVRTSGLYRSASAGAPGPDYLNAAVELRTGLSPTDLLAGLQRIEVQQGRVRSEPNAPRTLDLDLLVYAECQLDTAALVIPHPRLHERAFVLRPLAEIAPHLTIPGRGPICNLLEAVASQPIDRLDS
jgi:2-amino-4-hydroxy-6-hydroxymethyldihydropteridine diphosphokinase